MVMANIMRLMAATVTRPDKSQVCEPNLKKASLTTITHRTHFFIMNRRVCAICVYWETI